MTACAKPTGVELDEVDGRLGEHGKPGGADLGKTAADEEALLLSSGETDLEQAWAERGQKRRMMRKHGHVALGARHQHLLDLARDEQPLRRYELEFECVWHC